MNRGWQVLDIGGGGKLESHLSSLLFMMILLLCSFSHSYPFNQGYYRNEAVTNGLLLKQGCNYGTQESIIHNNQPQTEAVGINILTCINLIRIVMHATFKHEQL